MRTIKPYDRELMMELIEIQHARKRNWVSGEPADADLETSHLERIYFIRQHFSARHNVAGTSETPPVLTNDIGVVVRPAATFFRRLVRIILPHKKQK